jgi:hypothetical protein
MAGNVIAPDHAEELAGQQRKGPAAWLAGDEKSRKLRNMRQ